MAAVEADPTLEVTVDLDSARGARRVRSSRRSTIDDYTRWRLMEGLDDIGLTLRHADEITAFEDRRPAWKPRTLVG